MEVLERIEQRLNTIESNILLQKEVLTFDEGVKLTGMAKSYVYKLSASGLIPCSKPLGKHIFFSRSKLEAFLLSNPIKSSSELESEASTFVTLKKGRVIK